MTSSSPSDPPAETGAPPVRAARLDFDRPPAHPGGAPSARPTLRRMRRRRRRTVLLLVAVLAAGGAVVGLSDLARRSAGPAPAPMAAARDARLSNADDASAAAQPGAYPTEGPGRFTAAQGDSPERGYGGPLHRYRVEVEQGTGQDADEFAGTVDAVLGDHRSWIASGELRVRRVAEAAAADFTIYLATPATSERMCAEGGLSTERYTSCRLPGRVIINLARWMEAVPDYGAPLEVYRTYVINHEVGHEFGELHQACPGPGAPAPVMQQQTYGLDGCVANAWPYVDGARYEGDPVDGI
ncbi:MULTISPECIES: DUF3152 domain-containing protein [Micromonospora]|uniref:DUF3152 domain-containing protein n=1 Tax=Micromonospora solifontis TaxID=2487138 RepID=A0ABX9W9U6_9ACTN|nr:MULTISPECIES: DUF3152 domain-containing protein [Micromonospora]NES12546.1 DUF3152 domain-containing protein [Micromonospora sp. PPF5-17B]NES39171.1 DUF3152 domain-containing protein [Micromonospora solifontis]NES54569.1 DUF3152 domain-containing protein [Micromonospora sp. PPF5-6]RNL90360.1 DUF3152 domain-containing protein [Micromonospora solifontis]